MRISLSRHLNESRFIFGLSLADFLALFVVLGVTNETLVKYRLEEVSLIVFLLSGILLISLRITKRRGIIRDTAMWMLREGLLSVSR